jgi:hypothetical protein
MALIGEELPMESSRVDLDPDVKDRFGLPVPRITKHHHPNDIAMYDWYEKKILELGEAAGAKIVMPGRAEGVHIAADAAQKGNAHNHGTARMGVDASRSVLDKYCRSHEVKNLWDAAAAPLYKGGLAALDGVAIARFEKKFGDLEAEPQDAILTDIDGGTAAEWTLEQLPSPLFFETARQHTIIAFLADPSYGGNRDYAGWKVSGYPGPRHRRGGFTPAQVEGTEPIVPIWDRKG